MVESKRFGKEGNVSRTEVMS